eukprot:3870150-Pleurochrysis_carterae.AAC.2
MAIPSSSAPSFTGADSAVEIGLKPPWPLQQPPTTEGGTMQSTSWCTRFPAFALLPLPPLDITLKQRRRHTHMASTIAGRAAGPA